MKVEKIVNKITNKIYISGDMYSIEDLVKNDIKNIIDLTEEGQTKEMKNLFNDFGIKYYHIPMHDDLKQKIYGPVMDVYELINKHPHEKFLIHCHMGISRSCTVVIANLMIKYNLSLKDALKIVMKKRTCCNPNDSFMRQLMILENLIMSN